MSVTNPTRQAIFLEAIDMFSTLGYTESTMRELAKRVGIKSASLYYHYPSKEALLDEIFDYFYANDQKMRTSSDAILEAAPHLSSEEILTLMLVHYTNDEKCLMMIKILRIAIGYQFKNMQARKVFDFIFYDMALRNREQLFLTLIERKVFAPFDCKSIAYIITSNSLALFMQCANHMLPIEDFADVYNSGMESLAKTIAPLLRKSVC